MPLTLRRVSTQCSERSLWKAESVQRLRRTTQSQQVGDRVGYAQGKPARARLACKISRYRADASGVQACSGLAGGAGSQSNAWSTTCRICANHHRARVIRRWCRATWRSGI